MNCNHALQTEKCPKTHVRPSNIALKHLFPPKIVWSSVNFFFQLAAGGRQSVTFFSPSTFLINPTHDLSLHLGVRIKYPKHVKSLLLFRLFQNKSASFKYAQSNFLSKAVLQANTLARLSGQGQFVWAELGGAG